MTLTWHAGSRGSYLLFGVALLAAAGVVAGIAHLVNADLDHQSRLINVSCRGPAGTGPDAMLMAFVISDRAQLVVVRARGTAMPGDGAAEQLRDIRLRIVRNADGVDVGRNETWQGPGNERLQGDLKPYAPGDPRHAACVLTLPPGGYSALVEDRAGGRALATIEIFVVKR